MTFAWLGTTTSGVPFGNDVPWLSASRRNPVLVKHFVEAVVNEPETQGGELPPVIAGNVQAAIVYCVAIVTTG